LKNIHVTWSITLSVAHHFLYAITGVPVAIAATGTSQKSSSGGKIKALAFECKILIFLLSVSTIHSIFLFDFCFNSL
jgi:hypothetical protein